ncbi:LysR family transcriptional regulator [Budviciaceae bacterium CWB-B4]|uniref:LysR family transcriptional regulator n=1 Tax=Limnobaculum xujianqingii TaxID=2738837 RepID=A0A9D7AHW1_9GAMM|nr:LysR family transcriptional regulator [Limnobaculum xujianqingii]MBK5073014.1 LysR family transcriptional regulator [Limnobaculum xujianqingii]MBK5176323.1 LysR family transcriptional regulator [Limnobaculum xujianqingii]
MQNRHHLELTWLEDCVALAETLNFSKAAALRYVTQPAFSRRIQSLEEWVGTALFERNRRGVDLTRAGEVFCGQAPELIRTLYAVRSEALDVAGQEQPDVVFSATHALSFSFFPELLRRNDKIARFGSFRLLSDTLKACERMILQGGCQFLLCHYHPHMRINLEPEKFFSIRLGLDRLIPYSAISGDSTKPLWTVNNRKKFPYLSFSGESGLGRIISNTASINRVKRGMEVAFTSDLAATLLAMVRAGDGIAWLPQSLAEPEVKNGTIIAVADKDSDLCIPVEIRLYRPATKMSKAVEELWRIFVEDQQ